MDYVIVMPAYNEEKYIGDTLASVVSQSQLPSRLVIVDDNSTDSTAGIANTYATQYPWITVLNTTSENLHLPGSKVIRAFEKGVTNLPASWDIIVKLDADLILPTDYFKTIVSHFERDQKVGMAGGFAYIEKNGDWVLESLTDKDHIRGALKAYRRSCFEEIGGLRPAMGWDTVDELLCRFYGWKIITDESLKVKHLKPTGAVYDKSARYKQGEAFYTLGYGLTITAIASLKLAMRKGQPLLFLDYIKGYNKARASRKPLLVTSEQAAFIRRYRWSKIRQKLF
jgi:glycosyltransferase involved in cell wall biosynthesis